MIDNALLRKFVENRLPTLGDDPVLLEGIVDALVSAIQDARERGAVFGARECARACKALYQGGALDAAELSGCVKSYGVVVRVGDRLEEKLRDG